MSVMHKLRLYHATLVLLVLAAYFTGEAGIVHAWLGYGVALVILLRLLLALGGAPQLGLMRFYPHFDGLKLDHAMTHPAISRTLLLGIALSLMAVVASGMALDRGKAIGLASAQLVSSAHADEDEEEEAGAMPSEAKPSAALPSREMAMGEGSGSEEGEGEEDEGEEGEGGWLGGLHEISANLLMLLVALHVTYVVIFKRPLARFMVFAERGLRPRTPTPRP
jgi:cytochrome b